jgi:hypothetical protein
MKKRYLLSIVVLIIISCSGKKEEVNLYANPPEEGFDLANSEPAAIELADSIMAAMGGRKNWDEVRFISWNFSGLRDLVWDKHTGRVRIDAYHDSVIYLIKLNTAEGRVKIKNVELTGDSLKKMLEQGKDIWRNDSYWLVMPFKLKANGITLRYLGEDTLKTGGKYNVLEVIVNEPERASKSKYHVYVDIRDNLVKQWSYFEEFAQDSATFTHPWDNYRTYGNILLSADRSDSVGPRHVKLQSKIPNKIFQEF